MTIRDHTRNRPHPSVVDTTADSTADLADRLSAVHRAVTGGDIVALADHRTTPPAGRLERRFDREATVIDLPGPGSRPRRRGRFPILAAVLMTVAAHGVLAATIATRSVPPLIGAAAAAALAICGLVLIAAEAVAVVEQHRSTAGGGVRR